MVDALVAAMEMKGGMVGDYFIPDRQPYTAQVLTQQLYPKVRQHAAGTGWRRHDHVAVIAG